jgi:hypothetical protein
MGVAFIAFKGRLCTAFDRKFLFRNLSTEEIDEKWKLRCWTDVLKSGGVDPLITMSPSSGSSETN